MGGRAGGCMGEGRIFSRHRLGGYAVSVATTVLHCVYVFFPPS